MRKVFILVLMTGIVGLLGCPVKNDKNQTVDTPADCGCRTKADSNSICESFVSGRCGWCADKTCEKGELCSYLPRDVDFLQKSDGYSTFIPACQNAFDWFSWQSFVAVNWPAGTDGNPLKGPITQNPAAPRVWEYFLGLDEVFKGKTANHGGMLELGQIAKSGPHDFGGHSSDMEPGSDKPLLDRNLNFTLYEIRINKTQANYIKQNGLTTWCGQKKFYDSVSITVQFPSGSYKSDSVGSIEIKTAWRVLIPGVDDTSRYFTRKAIITVPAKYVITNVPIRDTVTVGLVGMHLVRNVSNHGSAWIWSSFEQVDNAPVCPNGKCPPGISNYSYYNPACSGCQLNKAPSAKNNNFLWSVSQGATKQYGRQYANGGYGSQIGRINPVEPTTDSISAIWQNKLKQAGSVWQYYHLIGSQWLNTETSHGTSTFGIPPAQANTAMESYLQPLVDSTGSGSCMGCHGKFATGSYSKLFANLSFTLSHAGQDSSGCTKIR